MSQEIVKELEEIFGGKLEQAKGDVGCAWNLHGVPVYYEVEKAEENGKAYFKDSVKYGRNEGRICYICEDDYKKYDGHVRDLIQSCKSRELDEEEFRDELDGHNDYVGVDYEYILKYGANGQKELANVMFREFLKGDDCMSVRDAMTEKEKVKGRNMSAFDEITVKEAYLKLLQDEFECVHGVTLDRNELENLYENVVLKSDEPNLINENDFHDCEDAFFSKEKDVSLEH